MKTISVLVPTFNEEANIRFVYEAVKAVMEKELSRYKFELVFIDNDSQDSTRPLIEQLCKKDKRVKAIYNAKNFGYSRSHFYGLTQMTGDAVMLIHADLQNPPELIPEFVKKWENGAKVVIGIKTESRENRILWFLRSVYYFLMKKISDVEQIEHFTDYELLDSSFIDVLRQIEDPMPYLRGIVAEMGFGLEKIYYKQNKRERGKSSAGFFKLYDFAMLGVTSYSKTLMRMATFIGGGLSFVSFIIAIVILVQKLLDWNRYDFGIAAIGVGVFLIGSIQLFFIGILGEYILSINTRTMKRPLVIEKTRINFKK